MNEPSKWLGPRRRTGRRNPRQATILTHVELGAMFALDDNEAIAAELRRRGITYHVSAGGIYTTAKDVLTTFAHHQ
jgi:hypothetical protein